MLKNDMDIDINEIPEITDFSQGRVNPFAGMFKNGYTVIIEHKNYDEIITVSKSKRKKADRATLVSAPRR